MILIVSLIYFYFDIVCVKFVNEFCDFISLKGNDLEIVCLCILNKSVLFYSCVYV